MTDAIVRNSSGSPAMANLLGVVFPYTAPREIRNILHPVLNSSDVNVTYKPSKLRAGRLNLLFATAAHAATAVTFLDTPYTFTLTADVSQASMTFALAPGDLDPKPEPGTDKWLIEVPFQEVS